MRGPDDEVPVTVTLPDGTTADGMLFAWCRQYDGTWRAWVRGDRLNGHAFEARHVHPRAVAGPSGAS